MEPIHKKALSHQGQHHEEKIIKKNQKIIFIKTNETYHDFIHALYSPANEIFNPFIWIYQFCVMILYDICFVCGIISVIKKHELHTIWRPMIPIFAISLMMLISFTYFISLRSFLNEYYHHPNEKQNKQQCEGIFMKDGSVIDSDDATKTVCYNNNESYGHDTILQDIWIFYLTVMTLFYYIRAVCVSPGVHITQKQQQEVNDDNQSIRWSARKSQGGFLGYNPLIDTKAERDRMQLYNKYIIKRTENKSTIINNNTCTPCTATSSPLPMNSKNIDNTTINYIIANNNNNTNNQCLTCQIYQQRPVRCHHCKRCNRCILQFDHHCIWVNNCIGYNNYRDFIMTLLFLVISCWYGSIFLLYQPFYQSISENIRQHGYHWLYTNGTGLLDLPPTMTLIHLIITGNLSPILSIRIIFPLLVMVGILLTIFLFTHIRYILTARTTLEDTIINNQYLNYITSNQNKNDNPNIQKKVVITNPYDQGMYQNFVQIIGTSNNWLTLFLPIFGVPPIPPPFLPNPS